VNENLAFLYAQLFVLPPVNHIEMVYRQGVAEETCHINPPLNSLRVWIELSVTMVEQQIRNM
jgi:hypothetical protein